MLLGSRCTHVDDVLLAGEVPGPVQRSPSQIHAALGAAAGRALQGRGCQGYPASPQPPPLLSPASPRASHCFGSPPSFPPKLLRAPNSPRWRVPGPWAPCRRRGCSRPAPPRRPPSSSWGQWARGTSPGLGAGSVPPAPVEGLQRSLITLAPNFPPLPILAQPKSPFFYPGHCVSEAVEPPPLAPQVWHSPSSLA